MCYQTPETVTSATTRLTPDALMVGVQGRYLYQVLLEAFVKC